MNRRVPKDQSKPRNRPAEKVASRSTQARGRLRRRRLLDAARADLDQHDIGNVSLQGIATRAGIPLSSVYHFYENKNFLFAALAAELGEELALVLEQDYPLEPADNWETIVDEFIDRGAAWCTKNRSARQLLIGPSTSPEIKMSGRANDRRISQNIESTFANHFELPKLPGRADKFFYFTEIVDLMLSLSEIYHGQITAEMVTEAKVASKAYLATFLPKIMPRCKQEDAAESPAEAGPST